ncbi:DUF1254 domain-containing protein [Rhizobium sp. BG4]|uniref:DUF1254 domain-containing protein n=1 Tax=Rhizobium sp. BG4 TaxID=2613770 RepID=UPI00193D52AC|nr:DUF1254 domain-containing protein [Rhizobium sp. BG4]QRM42607.1 DUF1254 domain-containing protein [Rhizobium sp. BG4]
MFKRVLVSGALALTLASSPLATADEISKQEAYRIAKDAYVYAYPLVLTYLTAVQTTNYAEPTGIPTQAPFNQFSHAREFTPVDFKSVVRPNMDTLYSPAVLDLGPEPMVLSVPATDRYFMLPLMSLWTDVFAVPGTRTTGANTARDFLLVSPSWQGTVPSGLEMIRSPTRYTDIVGRTKADGPADYDAVHKVQAGYRLVPLSAWGKGEYVPPKGKVDPAIDMKTPAPVQVDQMTAASYLGQFSDLLKDNPPGPFDYPIIHRLERVGFKPGQHFDLAAQSSQVQKAFERGTADGKALVLSEGKKAGGEGKNVKGWVYTLQSGAYGVDYLYRAAIAQCCLGENLAQDAVYPSLATDSDGKPLDGSGKYVLHFEKGKLPPVDGFWSVTVYDKDGYFIPNAIKRQALGDRSNLAVNTDGSVDILIQPASPGKQRESNWLPVAAGQPFNLLMRLYWSRDEVLDGDWAPPPVRKAM